MDTLPPAEPKSRPQPRSRSKKQEKKLLSCNIPEKLFILTIDDEQGIVNSSVRNTLRYGIAGAILAELTLANVLKLEEERLNIVNTKITGDELYDEIITMIATSRKPRKLDYWVDVIGSKHIIKQIAERLAARKVLTIEKRRYMWIIPYEVFPQVDASAKYWVKQHLRGIVLAGEKADASDIALLSLLKACQLLRLVFTRDERKSANKKVEAMVHGEVFGEAVEKLLADINAATVTVVAATCYS